MIRMVQCQPGACFSCTEFACLCVFSQKLLLFSPPSGPLHLTSQASQRPVTFIVNKLVIAGSVVCFRDILTAQISPELNEIGIYMDMQQNKVCGKWFCRVKWANWAVACYGAAERNALFLFSNFPVCWLISICGLIMSEIMSLRRIMTAKTLVVTQITFAIQQPAELT